MPHVASRDPYALRGLVLILAVAAFFTAGGDRVKRIAAAFDWHGVVTPANYRIDAWVTPPAYTGRPPLILPGLRPGEQSQARANGPVTVPAGSTLVVRATGQSGLDIAVKGGIAEAEAEAKPQAPKGTEERHFTITAAGTATVKGGGDDVGLDLQRHPGSSADHRARQGAGTAAPRFAAAATTRSRTTTAWSTRRRPSSARLPRRQSQARPTAKPPRPLFDAPNFALVLPQARTRAGAGQTTKDLSEHPWAGVDVAMTLVARDEANNEGRSSPHEMRLPERPFAKPLPRALIEQRRNLALDANAKDNVLMALDALTIAPERFIPETKHLSRAALDLLAACARRERRWSARRGGAAVGDGGLPRGRQRLGDREGSCGMRRKRCATRWSAAPPTKRSRS